MNPLFLILLLRPVLADLHLQARWEERLEQLGAETAAYRGSLGWGRGIRLVADRGGGRAGEELRASGSSGSGGRSAAGELRLRRRVREGWEVEGRLQVRGAGLELAAGSLDGRLGSGLLGAGRYRWDPSPGTSGARSGYHIVPRPGRSGAREDRFLTLSPVRGMPITLLGLPDRRRWGLAVRSPGNGFSALVLAGRDEAGAELTLAGERGRTGWRLTSGAWREGGMVEGVVASAQDPLRLRFRGWRLWGQPLPGGAGPPGSGAGRDAGWELAGAASPAAGWRLTAWMSSESGSGGLSRDRTGLRVEGRGARGALLLRLRGREETEPVLWMPPRRERRWDIDLRVGRQERTGTGWQAGWRRAERDGSAGGTSRGLWIQVERTGEGSGWYLRADAALAVGAGPIYSFEPGPPGTWRLHRAGKEGLRLTAGASTAGGRVHVRGVLDEEGAGLRVVLDVLRRGSR